MSRWSSAQYTDRGKIRNVNEDSLMARNQHCLWAVADGMGGHENGDYASRYVTEQLSRYCETQTLGAAIARIDRYLAHCNTHLVEKASSEQRDVIGCTVAVLHIRGDQAHCIWSGDSRIYRLRDSVLLMLTQDHNFESLVLDRDVFASPNGFIGDEQMLTGAIGGDAELQIEHCRYTVDQNDEYFICTDGLYKEVSDSEICETLRQTPAGEDAVHMLAELYQDRGARDNVGMIHVFNDN